MEATQGIVSVKEALAQVAASNPQPTQPDPEDVSQETTAAPAAEAKAPEAAPAPTEDKRPGSYAREWARVQKIEKQAKAAAAQAAAEREAAAKERAETAKLLEMVKQDPATFLLQHGGQEAYQAATRKILDQRETPEERLARIEKENAELRNMIPSVRDELRNEFKSQKATDTWAAYEREVEATTSAPEFADIVELDLVEETKNLAVEWFSQHGEALTARQAAEKMQEYLDTQYYPQLAKSEKAKAKLLKQWGLEPAAQQAGKPKSKTVTNKLTNNVPADDVLPGDKVLSTAEETRRVLRSMGVAVRE